MSCLKRLKRIKETKQPEIRIPEKIHYFGKWRLETDAEMPNPMFKVLVCTCCGKTANSTYPFCPECGQPMFE